MANFNAASLTKKGIALLAKTQAGQTGIEFTKAAAGNGAYGDGETLEEKEALKSQMQEFPIDKLSVINATTVSIRFSITNLQDTGNLTQGYYVKEVGIFARDPDEGEILYAVATAVEDQWDYMPAYNSLMPAYITVEFYAEVSNTDNVTIICAGRFITAEELEKELETLMKEAKKEHETIKKQIEGLNQVPEGVLTEEDKGAARGVASLDGTGRIPCGQLPPESGAMYLWNKLRIEDFTWGASVYDGKTTWIGTFTSSGPGNINEIKELMNGRWSELMPIMDLGQLYELYQKDYADYVAGVYSSLKFKLFGAVTDDNKISLKLYADTNLGESAAKIVAFWPYLVRKEKVSY